MLTVCCWPIVKNHMVMVSTILRAWIPVSHLGCFSSKAVDSSHFAFSMLARWNTKPPLMNGLPVLGSGLVVEEDDVDLLGQLGHGGEDEGERRDDHHRHRRERTYLRISAVNSVLWRSSDGKTTKQQVVVEEKVSFRWEWPYIKPRPTMWDRLRGKLNLRLIIGLESFNLKENLKLNNSSGTSTSKDVVSSPV